MRSILPLLFLLSCFASIAQNKKTGSVTDQSAVLYEQAKSLYDNKKYADAIPRFEECLKAAPQMEDAMYYLGLCYRYTNANANAVSQFEELKRKNPEYWAWFYYEAAIAYTELQKYDLAMNALDDFMKRFPKDASRTTYHHKARYKYEYLKQQSELRSASPAIKAPVKLPSPINSKYDDFFPMLDPTGKKLYFTSRRLGGVSDESERGITEGDGDDDIYYIEKRDGKWSSPVLLPEPINSSSNDGTACFSADGQTMVYVACGLSGGIGSCDLYYATLEGTDWTKPVNFGNVVNSKEWDSQPTLSVDGNRIIFVSDREGGYGDTDLYMIEKNIFGEWGPPMNLGGIVNTPFSEYSPFLSQDGKTLYFSSDGHPGFGSNDMFKTTSENGKWTTPINLGRYLNTTGNDRYFTIGGSGEVGYCASNIDGSLDLYEIEIPEELRPQPTVVVSGIVSNMKTGKPVGAYVMVEDLNTGELIAVNKSNSVTGKYLVVLPAGKTYGVSANKESYFFHSESFDIPLTAKFQEIKKDIRLNPIEKGAKIVLNNIFFETGKATLSPQSRVELDKATDLLKTNPSMVVEVGGHTDNVGDDTFNMKLSHDRAKSVRDFLVNAGIASNRIQSKGYGELNPVASNDTDDGRKTNRRTEFVILEF